MKEINIKEKTGKRVLVGRREGMYIANELLRILDDLNYKDILVVNLKDVERIDEPFIEQAFVSTMKILYDENGEKEIKTISFKVANEITKAMISKVMYDNDLIAIVDYNHNKDVIGSIGRALMDTFRIIYKCGEIASDSLPEMIGADENICTNRIKKLLNSGIIEENYEAGKKIYALRV